LSGLFMAEKRLVIGEGYDALYEKRACGNLCLASLEDGKRGSCVVDKTSDAIGSFGKKGGSAIKTNPGWTYGEKREELAGKKNETRVRLFSVIRIEGRGLS